MILTLLTVCRNEASTGHMEKFLKWNVPLFDHLLVYDDVSDDDTVSLLKQAGAQVLENEISIFKNELLIREKLLLEAKSRFPKTDWFMILDLDEVLTCSREELVSIVDQANKRKCTGVSFRLVNLWNSENYFRIDEYFDCVTKVHLWKNVSAMYFLAESGLHKELHPSSIKSIYAQESIRILHLGFSTQEKIVNKFHSYKKLGQEGRNLWRLIDENSLNTKSLASISNSLGSKISLWLNQNESSQPSITPISHYLWRDRELDKNEQTSPKGPFISIICLIYSGIDWLEFAYGELLLLQNELEEGLVEILFCANDASQEVIDYLISNNIPHIIFNNPDSTEYYISRVYRAYNYATSKAKGEYCLLVNSDMAYAPGFLTKMLLAKDSNIFLVAKLVESGNLKPGALATKKNFGKKLENFQRKAFYNYALRCEKRAYAEGGLFMPLLVARQSFLDLGGFPEGNLTPESLSDYLNDREFQFATPGMPCVSGDAALFKKAQLNGFQHVTSLRSIAYHFQEGEKRHASNYINQNVRSGFAIANDSLNGINNEQVLWGNLCEILEKNNIKTFQWNTGKVSFPLTLLRKIPRLKFKPKESPRVCLQNASYLPTIDSDARNVVLLQDNLRIKRLIKLQKRVLDNAKSVITNSIPMIDLNAKNHYIWQPLPINDIFLNKLQTQNREQNQCIFVGAFDDTKGWPEVREIVINNPSINFVLVSKYDYDSPGDLSGFPNNVTVYRKISQDKLIELYDQSTYFILGSHYETQCLAAIEAAARGVIIIMKETGLLAECPYASQIGFFGENLAEEFSKALMSDKNMLNPKSAIENMNISSSSLFSEWQKILLQELRKSFIPQLNADQTLFEKIWKKVRSPRRVS